MCSKCIRVYGMIYDGQNWNKRRRKIIAWMKYAVRVFSIYFGAKYFSNFINVIIELVNRLFRFRKFCDLFLLYLLVFASNLGFGLYTYILSKLNII